MDVPNTILKPETANELTDDRVEARAETSAGGNGGFYLIGLKTDLGSGSGSVIEELGICGLYIYD